MLLFPTTINLLVTPVPPLRDSDRALPPSLVRACTLSSSYGLPSISSRSWFLRPPSETVNLHWPPAFLPPYLLSADAWLATPDFQTDVPTLESSPWSTCASGSTCNCSRGYGHPGSIRLPPNDLGFLVDDLVFPCISPPPISPFPRTTVRVLTPSLIIGEIFFGRPARPPFRRSALDPDILPPPPTPHSIHSTVYP